MELGFYFGLGSSFVSTVFQPPTSGLRCWYKKGASSSSSWADSSGNAFDLTLSNSPTISNGAVIFDGITQSGRTLTEGEFNFASDFTVYMRVKPNSWVSGASIFSSTASQGIKLEQSGMTPAVILTANAASTSPQTSLPLASFTSVAFGTTPESILTLYFQPSGQSEVLLTGFSSPNGNDFSVATDENDHFAFITVSEILVYNVSHSQEIREKILSYLDTV